MPFLRHAGFVGREEDLARLHALLQEGRAVVGVRPVAAAGMGGIGKTQLTRLTAIEAQVCRIEVGTGPSQSFGTGFLVGPSTMPRAPALPALGPEVAFMRNSRRLACLAFACWAHVLPGSALAQVTTPPPAPPPEAWPAPPEPPKRWYGWQILIPTLLSDAFIVGGAVRWFAGSNPAFAVTVAGLVGHGIAGPIVHLAHRRPLTALASLALEAGLPLMVVGFAFAAKAGCGTSEECWTPLPVVLFGMPLALTAGLAIDSGALSWEGPPAAKKDADAKPRLQLAPLVLPRARVGADRLAAPAGVSLVGTF